MCHDGLPRSSHYDALEGHDRLPAADAFRGMPVNRVIHLDDLPGAPAAELASLKRASFRNSNLVASRDGRCCLREAWKYREASCDNQKSLRTYHSPPPLFPVPRGELERRMKQ